MVCLPLWCLGMFLAIVLLQLFLFLIDIFKECISNNLTACTKAFDWGSTLYYSLLLNFYNTTFTNMASEKSKTPSAGLYAPIFGDRALFGYEGYKSVTIVNGGKT